MDVFDAGSTRKMARRLLVVAGNQAGADAERVQAAHRFRGVGPQRIAKRQQSEKHAFPRNADDGLTLRFEFVDALSLRLDIHSFGLEKRRAADHEAGAAEACFDASTWDGLESLHLGQSDAAIESLFDNRASERV